jgi:hypothetical protein
MDNFDLKTEPQVKRKPIIWNILTILILLLACYLTYYFTAIFIDPNGSYNPFPPQSLPTLYQTPTLTPTLILLQPTWTPTQTNTPLPTRTKALTWTAVPLVATPTETLEPTLAGTPTITSTPMPASEVITYQPSTSIHTDLACNWMGVGGKVLDANAKPLLYQTVQLGGTLSGTPINYLVLSGGNPVYGTSGFEFNKLADKPTASTQTLWIQLFDNNGKPLTDKIFFDTVDDCAKNLVMIVFTKTR